MTVISLGNGKTLNDFGTSGYSYNYLLGATNHIRLQY